MNTQIFQMYDTDVWGSHASRANLGCFSSIDNALHALMGDKERIVEILRNNNRLFIEEITIDEFEGYSQVFDSDLDIDMLKKVILAEVINRNINLFNLSMEKIAEVFESDDENEGVVSDIKELIEKSGRYILPCDINDRLLEDATGDIKEAVRIARML